MACSKWKEIPTHGSYSSSVTQSCLTLCDPVNCSIRPPCPSPTPSCCRELTSVMSDSVRPHSQQPTRLPHPWDSSGKNTGVGCHFLLQCMKVKSESEVTQSCLTLSDLMDCSLPGSWSSPKPMSIELVMPSNHLILLLLLPSMFPSIWVFSNESALRIRWPSIGVSASSISPSNEYSYEIEIFIMAVSLDLLWQTLQAVCKGILLNLLMIIT